MSRRLLGAALLVVAAVAASVGTFLPLFREGSEFGTARYGFTTTSWDVVADSGQPDVDLALGQSAQFGVPIVLAAVLLVLAAALVFLPEVQRLAARYTAIAGTGLLAGSVWAADAVVVSVVGRPPMGDPGTYTAQVGGGVWVLGAAVLVAVVGVVLIHARRPAARPDGPVVHRVEDTGHDVEGDDADTPPFGIPVADVEVARLPGSGYQRPSEAPGDGR